MDLTLPVPGGPANSTALPAIFFDLIISTTTPAAYIEKQKHIFVRPDSLMIQKKKLFERKTVTFFTH